MPRKRQGTPRTLEPEGPDEPTAAPRPIDVEAVLGNALGSALVAMMSAARERGAAPPAAASAYPDTPHYRDVRNAAMADIVLRRCVPDRGGRSPSPWCGTRYVPRYWTCCPYCGGGLGGAVQ